MRKNNNIIEINGQPYDARTGGALAAAASPAPHPPAPAVDATRPVGRRAASAARTRRSPVRPLAAHRPHRARTLMRQAVKKPAPERPHRLQAHGSAAARAAARVVAKPSAQQLDQERWRRARQIPKSDRISHFPPFAADAVLTWPAPASKPAALQPLSTGRPADRGRQAAVQAQAQLQGRAQPDSRRSATDALLERALQQAASYQELPAHKRRRRLSLRRH